MHKILAFLVAFLLSTSVGAQAVTLTGAARVKLTLNCEANTKRCTGDIDVTPNQSPFWHAAGDTSGLVESSVNWLRNTPQSIDLNTRCTDPEGGALTITKQSGAVVGATLVAGIFGGTPTAVEASTPVFRCCDAVGPLCVDTGITFNVADAPPSDSTPDPFTFAPQTGVTQAATITSTPAVTITGINVAATVTVSGGTWDKNSSGIFTASAGSVVNGDTVRVRQTSSVGLNAQVQTTLTVGGVSAIFTSTTVSNPARVGVFYTLDYETMAHTLFNPESSDWPVNSTASHDGMNPNHLAMDEYGQAPGCNSNCVPANVRALPHFEVITSNPRPLSGTYAVRTTIYPNNYSPVVNYSKGSFQSSDKPRSNIRMQNGVGDLLWRTRYICSFSFYLPADYEEESDNGWTEFLVQNHTAGKNAWEIHIAGKGGVNASEWGIGRNRSSTVNSSSIVQLTDLTFDVVASALDAWNVFVVEWSSDNRSVAIGGSPLFKVWYGTYDPDTRAVEVPMSLKFSDTTTPFGFSSVGMPGGSSFSENEYKGSWHGDTQGPYTGGKTDPIVVDFDDMRCATGAGGYADVHPYQEAQP